MRSTSVTCATARNAQYPDLFHFRIGNFLTSSVIIVSSVSGNRLRAHSLAFGVRRSAFAARASVPGVPHLTLTSHLSPLTSHLSPLTSHLSPLTSHLSPLTSHLSPLTSHLSPLTYRSACRFAALFSARPAADSRACRTRGRLTGFNFLVEQFVLVILDLVLEFHPGDANEGFASCQSVTDDRTVRNASEFRYQS